MVELFSFNTLLFLARWVFIGLIYLALLVVLLAVRRELVLQTRRGAGAAIPAAGMAPGRLRVLAVGKDRKLQVGQVLPLGMEARIGAQSDNDVVLRDAFVSSHHARLYWDGAAWWLEDLGSRNGTTVDGAPAYPHQPLRVVRGARLGFGDIRLELLDD